MPPAGLKAIWTRGNQSRSRLGPPSCGHACGKRILTLRSRLETTTFAPGVADGVMVTQRPLEALFMVRIHVGQPFLPMKLRVLWMFAQNLHNNQPDLPSDAVVLPSFWRVAAMKTRGVDVFMCWRLSF